MPDAVVTSLQGCWPPFKLSPVGVWWGALWPVVLYHLAVSWETHMCEFGGSTEPASGTGGPLKGPSSVGV